MAPRKPPRPKTPAKDSIRIKLGGSGNHWSLHEFRALFLEGIAYLEAEGFTHVKGGNLYVSPTNAKGQSLTKLRGGHPLEDIVIAAPYRSAADDHGL